MKWVLVILFASGIVGTKDAPTEKDCYKEIVKMARIAQKHKTNPLVKCMLKGSAQHKAIMRLVRKDMDV